MKKITKVLLIIIIVILGIFNSFQIGMYLYKNFKFKRNEMILSYLNEKYPDEKFSVTDEMRTGDVKEFVGIDGSGFSIKVDKYYLYKVYAEKEDLYFGVEYLSKSSKFDDTYSLKVEAIKFKDIINEKLAYIDDKIIVNMDMDDYNSDISVISNKKSFFYKEFWKFYKFYVVIDHDIDLFSINDIEKILKIKKSISEIKKESKENFNIQFKFSNEDSNYFNRKDFPTKEEMNKLIIIKNNYDKLKIYFEDEYEPICIYYNKGTLKYENDNIYFYYKTKKEGKEKVTVEELIKEISELQ